MGSQCRDAGANMYLGSRSRAARQRVQDGQWRPAEMDACLARRSKTGMRVKNQVRRVVNISIRVADGRGSQYKEGDGDGFRKQ